MHRAVITKAWPLSSFSLFLTRLQRLPSFEFSLANVLLLNLSLMPLPLSPDLISAALKICPAPSFRRGLLFATAWPALLVSSGAKAKPIPSSPNRTTFDRHGNMMLWIRIMLDVSSLQCHRDHCPQMPTFLR